MRFLVATLSFVFAIYCESVAATSCQPPDKPDGGYFKPVQEKYLPGDKVFYYCFKGYMRTGKDSRSCQLNGKWSDKTPFCEWPVKLKNPMASSASHNSVGIHRTIDKDVRTCFTTRQGTGEDYKVFLEEPATVSGVRLYMPKGHLRLEISTVRNEYKSKCSSVGRYLEEGQWFFVQCNTSHTADSIYIQDISSSRKSLEICEVEVYVKDSLWCREPPDIFILNGWLQVSRDKATLHCVDGFRPGENMRLVCDNSGKWSGGILQCDEILCDRPLVNTSSGDWQAVGKESKLSAGSMKKLRCEQGFSVVGSPDTITCLPNGTWTPTSATCKATFPHHGLKYKAIIIAASTVVGVVVLTCFIIVVVLLMKRKPKPMVVVLKNGEESGSSVAYETQYSTITYDTMPEVPPPLPEFPSLPKSRPPVRTANDYSKPIDQYPPPYNTEPKYEEPHQQTPVNKDAILLGSLKRSPVYGGP